MPDLSGRRIVIAGGSGFLECRCPTIFPIEMLRSRFYLVPSLSCFLGARIRFGMEGRSIIGRLLWTGLMRSSICVGRTVNCIKTPDHQDEILRSRIESTRVLGQAMRAVKHPPPVWVQMSTAHIYGDPPSAVCTELSVEGIGFAPTNRPSVGDCVAESKLPDQARCDHANQLCDWPRSRSGWWCIGDTWPDC